MLSSFSRYRLCGAMESLLKLPPSASSEDDREMVALREQEHQHLRSAIEAAVEALLVGSMGYCFLVVWRDKQRGNADQPQSTHAQQA